MSFFEIKTPESLVAVVVVLVASNCEPRRILAWLDL